MSWKQNPLTTQTIGTSTSDFSNEQRLVQVYLGNPDLTANETPVGKVGWKMNSIGLKKGHVKRKYTYARYVQMIK